MGTFKSGTLGDILPESVAYPDGNLNHGASFYVQVQVFNPDTQSLESVDAVMHFNGNARSVYSQDSYTLTTADGQTLNKAFIDDGSECPDINNLIKVYDVPDDQFGKATVEELETFKDSKNGDSEKDDSSTGDDGSGNASGNASGNSSSDEDKPTSITSICNGTYPDDSLEVLYAEKIPTADGESFNTFHTTTCQEAGSIETLVESIDSTLVSAGHGFDNEYSRKRIANAKTTAGDIKTTLAGTSATAMSDKITDYNKKLKEARKKIRKKLLEDKRKEINSQNKVDKDVNTGITTIYSDSDPPNEITYYQDNIYKVKVYWKCTDSDSATYTKYRKYYIDIQPSDNIETLENRITKVGESLPYDKSKIGTD